ncbi:MAG: mechanosensitive ion channel family protein [Opitutaceae bacterium]|nr:mechanosensitive ion channel family protein [Opitutaceae bacterium]
MPTFIRFLKLAAALAVFAAAPIALIAQNDAAPPAPPAAASGTGATIATGSIVGQLNAADKAPGKFTDRLLLRLGVDPDSNSGRYLAAAAIVLLAFLLRRVVIRAFFALLNRLLGKLESSLCTQLSKALEKTLSTVVLIIGLVIALKVLRLPDAVNNGVNYAYALAIMLVLFWFALRVTGAVADHLHSLAKRNNLGVAAFMPWIKSALVGIVFVFGALMIAQGMGANVSAFLAGLGIGGLALALAAQDTVANVFGAVVVAVDQPFRIGETVQIGDFSGTVEHIGIRSTRLRTPQKTLVIIPNKTMASEVIVNLSRVTQRRVEITVGLTYDTTADKLEEIVDEIRRIAKADDDIDPASVVAQFTNFSASSLDVWLLFMTKSAESPHMQVKQRVSLSIMRAVGERGLAFAFPTQTLELGASATRALGEKRAG